MLFYRLEDCCNLILSSFKKSERIKANSKDWEAFNLGSQ